MKKEYKLRLALAGGLGVIALAAGVLLGGVARCKQSDGFLRGTICIGQDVSEMTPAEVAKVLETRAENLSITLTEGGEVSLTGKPADYGYVYDVEDTTKDLTEALVAQQNDTMEVIRSMFGGSRELISAIDWKFDETKFRKYVRSRNLQIDRFPSEDAAVVYDAEQKAVIVKAEVYGNQFKGADLQSWAKEQLDTRLGGSVLASEITMEFPDIYRKPNLTAQDEGLQKQAQQLSKYVGSGVTYTFGDVSEVLDYSQIMTFLDIDGDEVTLNTDKVTAYVAKFAAKYDTRFVDRKFKTHNGEVITIDGSTNQYGYEIVQDEEVSQLIEDIKSQQEVTRTPIYDTTNAYGTACWYGERSGNDDLRGNYVEVDLTDQMVYYYQNGEVVLSSECVTGNTKLGRGTHTGAYPIGFKRSPSVLKGQGYETKVKYWMPFHNGEGLHDAWWRGSFGGTIYKRNGSHGCVNLPSSKAKAIYEMIEVGYAVIVHW